jgi:SAM-dependent methyltransferase
VSFLLPPRPARSAGDVPAAATRVFLRRWAARTSHLLQVGCGDGEVLARLAWSGVVVSGVEADPAVAATARARGLDVVTGGIEDVRGGPYAVVALTGVLGRARSLDATLRAAWRLLEDGALLLVEDLDPSRAAAAGHSGVDIRGSVAARFDVIDAREVPGLYRRVAARIAGTARDGPGAASAIASLLCEERRLVRAGAIRAMGLRIVAVKR